MPEYIVSCETPRHVEQVTIPRIEGEETYPECRVCHKILLREGHREGEYTCRKCTKRTPQQTNKPVWGPTVCKFCNTPLSTAQRRRQSARCCKCERSKRGIS